MSTRLIRAKVLGILLLLLFSASFAASAQQPGSVQYNTVTIPAMNAAGSGGVYDEDRWLAVSITNPVGVPGIAFDVASEPEAVALATDRCRKASGGEACEIVMVSTNPCLAVAVDLEEKHWGLLASNSLGRASRVSQRICRRNGGTRKGCQVVFKECR